MHVFQNSKQLQQMQGYALAQVLVGHTAVNDFSPVLVRMKEFSSVKQSHRCRVQAALEPVQHPPVQHPLI